MMSLNFVLPEPLAKYLHEEIMFSLKNVKMGYSDSHAKVRADEIMNADCANVFDLGLKVSKGFIWRDGNVLPGLEKYGSQSPHYLWESLSTALVRGARGAAVYSEMEAAFDGGPLPLGTLEPLILAKMGYNKAVIIPLIL
jgi:hypothetical protein